MALNIRMWESNPLLHLCGERPALAEMIHVRAAAAGNTNVVAAANSVKAKKENA